MSAKRDRQVWGIRCKTCRVELLNVGTRASQYPRTVEVTLAEKKRHEEENPGHRVVEVTEAYHGN